MPNGKPHIPGGQVIIERVGRGDGGEYQCVENTTEGTTNTAQILVNVQCKHSLSIVTKTYHLPYFRPS